MIEINQIQPRFSPSCLSRLCFLCFFEPMVCTSAHSLIEYSNDKYSKHYVVNQHGTRFARIPRSVTYVDNTPAAIEDVTQLQAVMVDTGLSFSPTHRFVYLPAALSWRRVARGSARYKSDRISIHHTLSTCSETLKSRFQHFPTHSPCNIRQVSNLFSISTN